MFQLIKTFATVILALLLVVVLQFGVVLPLETALIHARLTAPPAGIWFEGNDLNLGPLETLTRLAELLPMVTLSAWFVSRFIPNKNNRIPVGLLSVVCLALFGLNVALQALLAPVHQYQASSEGITFPNASSSRGPLKWSDVTSIELDCISRGGGPHSTSYYEPSLVLHFADAMALDLWEGARRANTFTTEKTYVEDFLHHFGEIAARLPPAVLASPHIRRDKHCRQDFNKLQPSLTGSVQQGN